MVRAFVLSLALLAAASVTRAEIGINYGPSARSVANTAYAIGRAQAIQRQNALRQQQMLMQSRRPVYVSPYLRMSGSFVPGHYRSAPDGYRYNNWSVYPNVNPYTGMPGTLRRW